jgi:HD-GYP domain-containing protein (c-di-GMP phosphodiesterase class II)
VSKQVGSRNKIIVLVSVIGIIALLHYPRGLKGKEIALGARMFMVADVYDALTSERPYRLPVTSEEAISEIRNLSGSHFDPFVVNMFMTIAPAKLQEIAGRYQDADQEDTLVENQSL